MELQVSLVVSGSIDLLEGRVPEYLLSLPLGQRVGGFSMIVSIISFVVVVLALWLKIVEDRRSWVTRVLIVYCTCSSCQLVSDSLSVLPLYKAILLYTSLPPFVN